MQLRVLELGDEAGEEQQQKKPNKVSFMKYALKSVPGLADVGVLHGDGDGHRAPPRCLGGLEKVLKY